MTTNPHEEKQEDRRQRYLELAAKARREARAAYERSNEIASGIPFGQPILVGHHSEKRHRRDLDRIDRAMRRSVELDARAAYYEGRAAGVGTAGISGDDPEAVAKLHAKLAGLEHDQERMKKVNRAHKAYGKDPSSLDKSSLTPGEKHLVRTYKPAQSWEPHPFPPYQLQNNNANIRRVRKRVEFLKKSAQQDSSECTIGEVRVVDNVEANRLQLFFPGKPSAEVRGQLKRAGFRWAPSVEAWQRHRSNAAVYEAKRILGRLAEAPSGSSST